MAIHAVVQAGGRGQRIRAVARDTPKPLLPVGGVPMVERIVRQLADAGVRRVTVVVGANGANIRATLLRLLPTLAPDLYLDFFEEQTPLGNAGALAEIDTGDSDVLLCFADLVTDLDFRQLLRVHAERACNITLHQSLRELIS